MFTNINAVSDDTMPLFSLPDASGKMHTISEWQGKTLVINFWATWCQPCLKEIPEFIQLQTKYEKKMYNLLVLRLMNYPQ